MTTLLEIKEKIKLIYSKADFIILPIVKFLLAFVVLNTLNGRMGYMTQLDNIAVVLIAALVCSVLSTGMLMFFAAVISLAHMYALSMEVALVGLCLYLVMYLLYFRFSPRDSLVVVLTPLLFAWKIPYVLPLAVGLVGTPASAVSLGCGVAIHYLVETVVGNAPNIRTMDDMAAKIRLMIEGFLSNRAMVILIVTFGITVLVVYLLRRLSVNYAWTIAMVAGAMVEVMVLLIGDLLYETNIEVGGILLGALLGLAVCKVIEFFRFCVDYNRTERVQFEDDEYYYYVKAIPKMSVAMSTKTVKRINTQQLPLGASGTAGTGQSTRAAQGSRTTEGSRRPGTASAGTSGGATVRKNAAAGTQRANASTGRAATSQSSRQRTVTTERTAPSPQRVAGRGNDFRGGKSVTITNTSAKKQENVEEDDYEELF